MAICNILWTFGILRDHLVHFVFIFSGFGIMYQQKSGNPACHPNPNVSEYVLNCIAVQFTARLIKITEVIFLTFDALE
jgi:hypothetical protein